MNDVTAHTRLNMLQHWMQGIVSLRIHTVDKELLSQTADFRASDDPSSIPVPPRVLAILTFI